MSISTKFEHDKKLDSLASDYLLQGYTVVKEPPAELIPFDLNGYRPDLLVTKGDSNLIVEVKTKSSRISVDRFQSIAQEIARHSGWRFVLVTLDDIDLSKTPTADDELPTWAQLDRKLAQARTLIEEGAVEPATLYLWSIFEAALRKRAIILSIPVERLPASMLIKHMYSQGEVSINDFDLFLEFMNSRNRLAHGGNEKIDPLQLALVCEKVSQSLSEWSASYSA
jgi:hypothetical protein